MSGRLDASDGEERLQERRPLLAEASDRRGPIRATQLVGCRETDRSGDVLRSGAAVALLGPALLLREDMGAVSDVEGTDALRALELMRAERHQIGAERLDVELDIWRRLDRIDVEHDAFPSPDTRRDLGDRLERSDLVIGEHDRDEDRLVVERRLELVGVHAAVPIDRKFDDLEAELLEVPQGMADRVMLDRRRHDAVAMSLACPRRALQRQVVRLGPARREHDLPGAGIEAAGDTFMRLVQAGSCRSPERMGG